MQDYIYVDGALYHASDFSDDFLAHHGVKGMKWGVRKSRPEGVSRSTNRRAKKDAKEFTKAKMYYGKGAGIRRKHIKATVEQRSKLDPSYKKAFDHHVSNTDLSKRSRQAKTKRRVTDAKNSVTKTSRGLINIASGKSYAASSGAVALATVAVVGYRAGGKKYVDPYIKKGMNYVFR